MLHQFSALCNGRKSIVKNQLPQLLLCSSRRQLVLLTFKVPSVAGYLLNKAPNNPRKWILECTSHHKEGQKKSKYQKGSCQSDLQVANLVICLTLRLGMRKLLLRELSETSNMNLRLGLQISTCLILDQNIRR